MVYYDYYLYAHKIFLKSYKIFKKEKYIYVFTDALCHTNVDHKLEHYHLYLTPLRNLWKNYLWKNQFQLLSF